MSKPSGVSEQIISLPKGGGAIKGLGEKFQPDLHSGTGNFSIPIALPPGRNGFQPQLSLSYSTGSGNGPFGLGWSIGIPNVSRKTSKGIPKYHDKFEDGEDSDRDPVRSEEDEDIFILSGSEDLVHVGDRFYRPRTEGLFARIRKTKAGADDGQICWQVTTKDGIQSTYGKTQDSRVFVSEDGITKIFQWLLSETVDTFGNKIVYNYKRDDGADIQSNLRQFPEEHNHSYNQTYLQSIEYIDYEEQSGSTKFLFKIEFDYGQFDDEGIQVTKDWDIRLDRFSSYNAGFEIRTARRCKRILIKRRLDGEEEETPDGYELVKSYKLEYEQDEFTNVSLLKSVQLKGHKDGKTESFPPITFGYTKFEPEKRKYETLSAQHGYLPESSLADPNYEIIDLFGNGLPCIVHSSPTTGWRYWRNLGNMQFAFPKPMNQSPAEGVVLEDDGVQFADMNGDGSVDLLVTTITSSNRGYYSKDSAKGEWKGFHRYHQAPSFNLKDPNVKIVDMDGDSVVDVLATFDHHFLYICNTNHSANLEFASPVAIERKHDLDKWPDVYFGAPDQKVRLADMSGDGLQDIVLVHSGRIDYWPNIGYGKFGRRITMRNSPRFPYNFDPKRLFFTDVNSDGSADLVYVDFGKVYLWINQSGNSWSQEMVIHGTPRVTNSDSVRVADMKGTGTAGVLWSYDYSSTQDRKNYKYLDFTGGIKPFLLNLIENNIGAKTAIEYCPSTYYYLKDMENDGRLWKTKLPFPVPVVAKVEIVDEISGGKFATEYIYHHGYWDGKEREFRGFGRVDQRDSETFENYDSEGLHPGFSFQRVNDRIFSPPTEVRTWFHQGPVETDGDGRYSDCYEVDFSDEFWSEDPQGLVRPQYVTNFLASLHSEKREIKRDALRSLRGRILRTELYALDGTELQNRPYTVTEYMHGILPLPIGELLPADPEEWQQRVFFPCTLAERITEWERGNDPMTQFKFTGKYDKYGHPQSQISIAVPRGRNFTQETTSAQPYLATYTETKYARRDDDQRYIVGRVASITTCEVKNDGTMPVFVLEKNIEEGKIASDCLDVISQTLYFYDGPAFQGRPFGEIGDYGALVRTETLVLTDDILNKAYKNNGGISNIPPYLSSPGIRPVWPSEYPKEFQELLPLTDIPTDATRPDLKNTRVGYGYSEGVGVQYKRGYFAAIERRSYDFHEDINAKGLVKAMLDALGHKSAITYDRFQLLPIKVIDSADLLVEAEYDYRVAQPILVTDPNGNQVRYTFTPMGLLEGIFVSGKPGENQGDKNRPSTKFVYNLTALNDSQGKQPIHIRTIRHTHYDTETGLSSRELNETIETVEYSDGFGRLIQTRNQAEDIIFGDQIFGDIGLPADQTKPVGDAIGLHRGPTDLANVVVSGWQVYDNKGRVVEEYEPFFSQGWKYARPTNIQFGQKITSYYDARGRVICTVNPDNSEQRLIYGIPARINNPLDFIPSPWEIYTYDVNDNAGRTHPIESAGYQDHYNTPMSIEMDALGHTIKTVDRNGHNPISDWHTTRSTYDIRGNVIEVRDTLDRPVFQYVYDLANKAIRTEQLDAGVSCTVVDAASNTIEYQDAKGTLILRSFDILNRMIRMWARDRKNESITLREMVVYGDNEAESGMTQDQAVMLNLLGKIYKHFDEAGLLSFIPDTDDDISNNNYSKPYDFKGNVLEKIRQVVNDRTILSVFNSHTADWKVKAFRANWQPPAGMTLDDYAKNKLDSFRYSTSTRYDALNRIVKIRYPRDGDGERKELHNKYNRSGALESVEIDQSMYVEHIAYNAKGRRTLIIYGNKTMTRYVHDPVTFRLVRMRTENFSIPPSSPGLSSITYSPAGKVFQDFAYVYDLAGNILTIRDRTPGSGVTRTKINELDRAFTYDALYRLFSATGRECRYDILQLSPPWNDTIRCNDPLAAREYHQEYQYDPVGNVKSLEHYIVGGKIVRQFTFETKNGMKLDRLHTLSITDQTYQYSYDDAGNLKQEGSSRYFEWDHSNFMRAYYVKLGDSEPSKYVHYLYDSSGNRIKKLVRTQGGRYQTSIYIDELFEFHRNSGNGSGSGSVEENNNLHIMDDNKKRVALVRIGSPFRDDRTPSIKYQIGDHLNNNNVVIDSNGNLIDREEYSPYGETSFGSFARKRYRFAGKEKDEESSLYYYGARYFAPWLARWISCDPLGMDESINAYSFVRNRPMVMIDPSGAAAEQITYTSTEQQRAQCLPSEHVCGVSPYDEPYSRLDSSSYGPAALLTGNKLSTAAQRPPHEHYRAVPADLSHQIEAGQLDPIGVKKPTAGPLAEQEMTVRHASPDAVKKYGSDRISFTESAKGAIQRAKDEGVGRKNVVRIDAQELQEAGGKFKSHEEVMSDVAAAKAQKYNRKVQYAEKKFAFYKEAHVVGSTPPGTVRSLPWWRGRAEPFMKAGGAVLKVGGAVATVTTDTPKRYGTPHPDEAIVEETAFAIKLLGYWLGINKTRPEPPAWTLSENERLRTQQPMICQ